jgi:methylated-DNA-protein-cysteine methyltransferase-like protein
MSNDFEDLKLYDRIYLVVQQIPTGQVATYGQVATIVGRGCTARMVGYAMSALKPENVAVPWQRVINAKGEISPRDGAGPVVQRVMLEKEGVTFDEADRVDFDVVGWEGPPWQWLEENQLYPAPVIRNKKKGKSDGEQLPLF